MDDLAASFRTLRPSADHALEAWLAIVAAERHQVEALPNRAQAEDFYAPMAHRFREDPRRTGDVALDLVLSILQPGETWLDLGAGGGRYALPIALQAGNVIAVEPSEGMRATLQEALIEEAISNVEIYPERWPGPSQAPVADVGFLGHVGYDIEDIGPFLDQLEAHSTRLCAALLFVVSPTSEWAPLWRLVHGEPKVTLPGLREFSALLYARGRRPQVQLIDMPPRIYPSLDAMAETAQQPLFVKPESNQAVRLRVACSQAAVLSEGGFVLSETPRTLGLITWKPR